jgi:hypothetical protein
MGGISPIVKTTRFVEIVMVPNCQAQIESLGLQTNQIMIWLLDCSNVHKS